ncbi:MAG: hypothetical protein ACI83H_001323 [Glaciecola sp.]|jgi:hypothetical protein
MDLKKLTITKIIINLKIPIQEMRKILLFNITLFIFSTTFGQINYEDKVNIYDYDSLSVDFIYDDFDQDGDLDIIKYVPYNSQNMLLQ